MSVFVSCDSRVVKRVVLADKRLSVLLNMIILNEDIFVIILFYGEAGRNIHQAVSPFNDTFPDIIVGSSNVYKAFGS